MVPFSEECLRLLRRRIRATRGTDRHWSMRTSELLASSLVRLAASAGDGRALPTGKRLAGLLRLIADHVVIDRIRRRIVQRRAHAVVVELERAAEPVCDPQDDADAAEAQAFLAAIVAELPPDDRLVVDCRMRGQPWAVAALQLGVDERAVRKRWQAVRRRMQAQLARRLRDAGGRGGAAVAAGSPGPATGR